MATNQLLTANKLKEWRSYVSKGQGKNQWQCIACKYTFTGGKTRFQMHILGPKPGQLKQVRICPHPDPKAVALFQRNVPLGIRDQALIDIHSEPINMDDDNDLIHGNIVAKLQGKGSDSASSGKLQQNTIDGYLITQESEDCDMMLKRWAVCCRVPFAKLDHPYFRAYTQKVNQLTTTYLPPKRYGFSPKKLIPLYLECEAWKVNHCVTQSSSCTIITDGWEDNRVRSAANFLLIYANDAAGPIHLGTVDCVDYEKNAMYIADEVEKMIRKYVNYPEQVCAFVPDSAGNMVKAGKLLEARFPFLLYYGCHLHKLNWVFQDAMEAIWVQRLQLHCKEVIHVFKRHHATVALLYQKAKEDLNKEIGVIAPAATRVAYWFVVVERIVVLKPALIACTRTLTWEREKKKSTKKTLYQEVQRLLSDDPEDGSTTVSMLFWSDCNWFLYAFEPLYEANHVILTTTLTVFLEGWCLSQNIVWFICLGSLIKQNTSQEM